MRRTLILGALFIAAVGVVGTALAAVDGGAVTPSSTTAARIAAAQQDPEAELAQDARVGGPRDPFRPLIEDGDPLAGSTTSSSSTVAGSTTSSTMGGTTSSTGATTSTTAGGTTSTTGFVPGTVTVSLKEIRTVSGQLQATIEVDGVDYIVRQGDDFADDFSVVTLFSDRAVLSFQGRTFELRVGESILK